MGLCSFGCCSGMSSLLWWSDCIYICSYGSRRVGFFFICLRSVIDITIFMSAIEYVQFRG